MIERFVQRFDANREVLRAGFRENRPSSYEDLIERVVRVIGDEEADPYGRTPDPQRIHALNDGDYQGTLVFVIGATGYQPSDYWYVKVGYGSCSGCDTFQAIQGYGSEITDEEIDGYMTLCLHIVQGIAAMQDEVVYG